MNRNVTATILIILAIGIYFTVTEGIISEGKSVQAVNKQYISAIDSAAKLIKVRDKVLADWKNISADDQDKLDKMLPSTVDNIRLIIDLNSVALQHGFALKNIKASVSGEGKDIAKTASVPSNTAGRAAPSAKNASVIPTPTLDSVNVSFSVTAPYLQFKSFLQDLEADLRLADLTHLAVTANDSGTYDFNVEMKTYWLRQQ